jgi:uncharacterized protein (TIGR03435 family)
MKLPRPLVQKTLLLVSWFSIGVCMLQLRAQSAPGQAPTTTSERLRFDVASVKRNTSGEREYSNIPLRNGVVSPATGGLFSARNLPLLVFIGFAYNLTADQFLNLQAQLPKWVASDRFDIEARADRNVTRAQMQSMMQSLLADRFKLAAHTESKQGPVYGLVLAKSGKTGPRLQPDAEPCSMEPTSAVSDATPENPSAEFPTVCGFSMMKASAPGRFRVGGRSVTLGVFIIYLTGPVTGVDRPVVDKTGLTGTFNLSLEFAPGVNAPLPPGASFQPDPDGPTFFQALQEQLGLKLSPEMGPVSVFVVDHVEEPSAN